MNTFVAPSAKQLLVRQSLAGLLLAGLLVARPSHAANFTVLTTNDNGGGSFRQALLDANAAPGLDTITFAVTNIGKTIIPASALPAITEPVTLDGATQPGYSNAPLVELNGASAGAGVDGLRIWTSNSLVRALCINRFTSDGIEIATNGFNSVQGCWIGLGLDGVTARANTLSGIFLTNSANNLLGNLSNAPANYLSGNTQNGVHIGGITATNNLIVGNVIGLDRASADKGNSQNGVLLVSAPGNTIGGTTSAAQNILSGNNSDGLEINGTTASNNVVRGNLIGTDATGTLDRFNSADGILITGASGNLIGGIAAGAGNRIVNNNSDGIEISGLGATLNVVQGNWIGTDSTGAFQQGNAGAGVNFSANARTNTLGGINAGEGNRLQFNTGDGVYVNTGTNNTLRGNCIFQNGDLGIDLGTTGITANDNGDPDAGANLLQNFPLLTAVTNMSTNVVLVGTLNSRPSQTFAIDFYASWLPDSVTNGEGQFYLGSTNVTTDVASNATFTVTLPVAAPGRHFTATATDIYGNTSELGPSIRSVSLVSPAAFTVVNTNDSGAGSLRQAIIDSNSRAGNGTNTIVFNISSAGVQRISPASPLPPLAASVVLDGYTQSGATANTLANGFNANLLIRLDGTNTLGTGVDGLQIAASNCVVRGLYLTSFSGDGLEIASGANSAVEGCVIGLDAANMDLGNTGNGVLVNAPVGRIGGTTPAARNLLSGNQGCGVRVDAGGAGSLVQGNFVGPDASGALDRGNATDGVLLSGVTGCTVGGAMAGAGNLLSGNTSDGVEISSVGATMNYVLGNRIGTDASGALALANSGAGIQLTSNPRTNFIGGAGAGEGNLIAFNTTDGVQVGNGTNNAIRGNAIFSNGDLGIDLSLSGVTANDGGDPDTGANQLQNFPVLTVATNSASGTEIRGTLNSRPSTTYTLDFYSNVGIETSGYGEGQVYLGSGTAATDAGSNVVFVITGPATNLIGRYLTATATDPFGNTSEFSASIPVASLLPGQTFTVVNTNDSGAGSLRQAILDANAAINSGDTILFAIPGAGPHTNTPASALPALSDEGTTINGYSQSGAGANTLTNGGNAVIKLKLDGVSLPASTDLLRVTASNCVIRGLALVRAKNDAIELLSGAGNCVVDGCFIGLDTDGVTGQANSAMGVNVNGTGRHLIGGATPAARNLISGNSASGVQLSGAGAISNVVQGNFIGTDRSGTLDKGNSSHGVLVSSAPGNRITGNLICGNGGDGIQLTGVTAGWNVVQGNTLGTDLGAGLALPNSYGIEILANASTNTIGGTGAGEGNRIWFHPNDGIAITAGTNNAIRGNSIFANHLGIDLGSSGVATNDLNDADTGANQLQNFPMLTAVTNSATNILIHGTLNSAASSVFQLDFFANPAPDASGYGEAQVYLGSTNVTTGGTGNGVFVANLPVLITNRYLTATATDPFGNTSELSAAVPSVSLIPPVTLTVVNTNDSGAGSLRQALLEVERYISASNNTIAFNLPGGGPHVIPPLSQLPTPFEPVTIDGYTQPGASANTLSNGFNAVLKIVLDGISAGAGVDGLKLSQAGNVVRGLNIIRFGGEGLEVNAAGRNTIAGNVIGLGLDGTDQGNGANGVRLVNCASNTVGGLTPAARNILSGNQSDGLEISGLTAAGNLVVGNFIGLGLDGLADRGNSADGVLISAAPANLVGGTSAAARNVISGNNGQGLQISSVGASNNVVQGNYVGTDATGTADVGNSSYGVYVSGVPGTLLGGGAAGAGNLLSGNSDSGVFISGVGATGTVIAGNRIGTDTAGAVALGNSTYGIEILDGVSTRIGGAASAERNLVSGNLTTGIYVRGGSATNVSILGNYIGTDLGGARALPNSQHGVLVSASPRGTILGGTGAGEANVIAFNLGDGVQVASGTHNAIRANSIFDNGDLGLDLGTSGVTTNDAGDADTGANQLQNFPLLTAATNTPAGAVVAGTLNSASNTTYALDFFANSLPDASGNGEGRQYLGSGAVPTDPSGNATFLLNLPTVMSGRWVTATASDPFGNTSEFGPAIQAMSTLAVTNLVVVNTNDSGAGSLRAALETANAWVSGGNDMISFNIPGAGVRTIAPASSLPVLSDPVTIDGYTQPTASANTLSNGHNAVLRIRLEGSSAGGDGLVIAADNSVIRGLCVFNFPGHDLVELQRGTASRVEGCFLGVDTDGVTIKTNTGAALRITGAAASGNTIGGTTPAARNVLSGEGYGVTASAANGNTILGNFIGTDASGTQARGNRFAGVQLVNATNNLIGGTVAGARNVLSGNGQNSAFNASGVLIQGGSGNRVEGNFIGTDGWGTNRVPNAYHGVMLENGASGNVIGGTNAAARNLISGNGNHGISFPDSSPNCASNRIEGNWIGLDATGTNALGNSSRGLYLYASARTNSVGGSAPGARNVISGNGSGGLSLEFATGNSVQGNFIGTDASGTRAVGNLSDGVYLNGSSSVAYYNRIGGTNAGEGNVIAYNAYGVWVVAATANPILGNAIYSNNSLGIDLSPSFSHGVSLNDVGDADAGGNKMQNFPVLYHGASAPGVTTVRGSLNSATNGTFRLEFFANDAKDSSGYGEGQQFLGATSVVTDGSGNASFAWDFPPSLATNRFVTATATDTNDNTSEFSAAAPVVPHTSVDLKVAVFEPGDPLRTGVPFTYTITVTNFGPTNATSVVVTDTLPANVSYVTATTSQGTISHSSGVVTVNLGTLNLLSTASINLTVQPTATGSALNTAAVSTPVFDHDPANNTASISTFLGIADVSATVTDTPDPIVAGQLLTVTYAVSNAGPDVATAVVLTANVDSNSQVVSATPSQGTVSQAGWQFNAAFGTLAVGATATLTVATIPLEQGTAFQSAFSGRAESDPVAANNSAQQPTEVLAGPGVFQFYAADQAVTENAGFAYLFVRRTGGALVAATIQATTANLSALSGLDYLGTNVMLSFATNQTEAYFTVPILNDTEFECNETFRVWLSNPTAGTVAVGLTNATVTIYENDIVLVGQVTAVSTANTNLAAGGNDDSNQARLSADGRQVVFASQAWNLTPNDYPSGEDLFIRDLANDTTRLITADPFGYAVGSSYNHNFDLSPDGRWVAFGNYSDGLVLNDTNGLGDVFLRDTLLSTTSLISVNLAGDSGGNEFSALPVSGRALGTNGQRVVFESYATDLVAQGDANLDLDVFVREVNSGHTILASVNRFGNATGDAGSSAATISADGSAVAFASYAADLVPGDTTFQQDVFVRYLASNLTVRVTVATNGVDGGNQYSSFPQLGASGRYVAFQSYSSNLTTNQNTGSRQAVFWRDVQTGETRLASVATNGAAGNQDSHLVSLSPNGRFVLFTSEASNLAPGDTNGYPDVYVRDVIGGVTWLVSLTPAGTAGNQGGTEPALSDEGRYVVFYSASTNLVPTQTPSGFSRDIYVRDLVAGTTTLVTHSAYSSLAGNGLSHAPDLSADGSVVAYASEADDLVRGDGGYYSDVFAWNRAANSNELVSIGSSATPLGSSFSAVVSGNGSRVAFVSDAANLAANDGNQADDVFLRTLATGQTTLVSRNSTGSGSASGHSGSPLISSDGRYVAFVSAAADLTPLADSPGYDAFLYDATSGTNRLLSLNRLGTGGGDGDSYLWDMSPDGRYVVFTSSATNLVTATDTNEVEDVFLRDTVAETTTLISVTPAGGAAGAAGANDPAVSSDGRYVAFLSPSANLLPGSTSNRFAFPQVLVRDRTAGTTVLASAAPGALPAAGVCGSPGISSDGRYVLFETEAANLAPGDLNGTTDVFVRDLLSGTTLLASATDGTTNAGNGLSYSARLSDNGRYVVFVSDAANLVPNDGNDRTDVFVRDLVTGDTTLVSAGCAGTMSGNAQSYSPSLSPDGRYVVFVSAATDLVPGYVGGFVANIFRRDLATGTTVLLSRDFNQTSGGNSQSSQPDVSDSGGTVVFASSASNLVANDANQREDVFVWQSVTSGGVDLALSKSSSTNQIQLGGTFGYTLGVSNLSTNSASGVQVTDPVPYGLLVTGAGSSQGTLTANGNLLTFNLGTLAPGGSATLTIQVQAVTADWKVNTAVASATQFDTGPANNTASVSVYVIPPPPPPSLEISLDAGLLTIRWPSSATGYALQTTTNLVPLVHWTSVTNSVLDNGTWRSVFLTPNPGEPGRFYRLRKP